MKKFALACCCILVLSSFVLATQTIPVKAYRAGYETQSYWGTTDVTFDGRWTSTAEWDDALQTQITANVIFRHKWTAPADFSAVWENYLIEIFNDGTNDASDYFQVILDGTANGGSAPQADDIRIDFVGHNTLRVYVGNGTGWSPAAAGTIVAAGSFGPTWLSAVPHWMVEIGIEKFSTGMGIDTWIRVAAYDASNSAAGVQAWPPLPTTTQDVPDGYGLNTGVIANVPEGIGFGVMVLLSTVAVVVGAIYLRKTKRTASHN